MPASFSLNDLRDAVGSGLDRTREIADGYHDLQLKYALVKDRIKGVDRDSGTYLPSDLEREQALAEASRESFLGGDGFLGGEPIFGLPPLVVIGGGVIALAVVMSR